MSTRRVSRQSEKVPSWPKQKVPLDSRKAEGWTKRDEPGGTGQVGMTETGHGQVNQPEGSGREDRRE